MTYCIVPYSCSVPSLFTVTLVLLSFLSTESVQLQSYPWYNETKLHWKNGSRGDEKKSSMEQYDTQTLDPLPYFDWESPLRTNITAQAGTDVVLSCRVNRLNDKVISWMKRDRNGTLKLLSYGLTTYNLHSRQTIHFEGPNNWQIQLAQVSPSDSGLYQCQTSTHPPLILNFTLNVISPQVEIVDDGEKRLKEKIFKAGSTLELRCIVGPLDPALDGDQHVSWYHERRLLNNDTFRGGISVKSWVRKVMGRSKLSKLYVANVERKDSGRYTCSMDKYGNASVYVSVLNGETPAAMHHGNDSTSPTALGGQSSLMLFNFVVIILLAMYF